MSAPARVLVLDIGKTNAKAALVEAATLAEIDVVATPNRPLNGPPYPHADVDGLWRFLLDAAGRLHARHGVDAIAVTTHGATAALIDAEGGLALPVLDYEHDGPDELAPAYDAARPDFATTGTPRLPAGLNLGAQLFWQFRRFPEAAGRAAAILTYPQYWAWRLCGVPASEATSLGCHTDLWNPHARGLSPLVAAEGWDRLMPPLRRAADRLGPIAPGVAAAAGLDPATPVACGIHDSNASLLPHLMSQPAPFAVVSTGTWVVAMAIGGRRVALDPRRDTLINVSAFGDPVPSARFMGGREWSRLTRDRGIVAGFRRDRRRPRARPDAVPGGRARLRALRRADRALVGARRGAERGRADRRRLALPRADDRRLPRDDRRCRPHARRGAVRRQPDVHADAGNRDRPRGGRRRDRDRHERRRSPPGPRHAPVSHPRRAHPRTAAGPPRRARRLRRALAAGGGTRPADGLSTPPMPRAAASPLELSPADARRVWLHAQRLDAPAPFGVGAAATQAAVEHLGYVQIDTINVIERSHHHILWTRIPDYRRADLHQALSVDKTVFEYWTHALAYVPTREFRFFLADMRGEIRPKTWFRNVAPEEVRRVVARVRREGALSIRDIDDDELVDKDHPWASRKPSKRALQLAFFDGLLTISARAGMVKTYELTGRHFGWAKPPRPATERQRLDYFLDRALRAQGVVSLGSIQQLGTATRRATIAQAIAARVARRHLLPVTVAGVPHWIEPAAVEPAAPPDDLVHILSPFDPLVIQRGRLKLFFGYDHRFEAYVPKAKRVLGYFALPVLVGDRIVAAIDLKADRARRELLIQQWTWVGDGSERADKVRIDEALHRFERFQFEG